MKLKHDLVAERVHLRNPSMNIVMKGTIVGECNKEKVAQTIERLKKVHPFITSTIQVDKNGDARYVQNTANPLEVQYYQGQNKHGWKKYVEEQDKIPFDFRCDSLMRIAIFEGEGEFQLVMIIHHLLGDGISISILFRDFIGMYNDENLILPVEEARLIEGSHDLPDNSKLNIIFKTFIKGLNKRWSKAKDNFSEEDYFEMFHNYHVDNGTNVMNIYINGDKFERLKKQCHDNNTTITAAITSAFLAVQEEMKESNMLGKSKCSVAVNVRNKVKFNASNKVGNYASGITLLYEYDENKKFWENTKELGEQLKNKLNEPKQNLMLVHLFSLIDGSLFDAMFFEGNTNYKNDMIDKVRKLLGFNGREKGVNISNIGQYEIDTNYGELQLKDVVYIPPASTVFDNSVGVVSVGDTLTISTNYKEKYISRESMKQLLEKLEEQLCYA